jgi:cyclohexanone monooxygenase
MSQLGQGPAQVDAISPKIAFDPVALREKYRQERDKRLRQDGKEQYLEVAGECDEYLKDPYAEPIKRDPVVRETDVFVIGGGFGGLLAAVRLQQAGVSDVVMVERAGDYGGTWYWNRYPGAQCDIESYVYMPLLDEMGYVPTEKYAYGTEILEYSKAIGRRFGLYENTYFQTEVTDLRWDDDIARWCITTDRGDEFSARFVCMSTGPLQRPKLPGIPGIKSFTGHSFHTSRWDYAYTGGDHTGNLAGLQGKRVAIIGTGATSVQAVPHLATHAKELYVIQRTPISVGVRGNKPTDPEWAKSLEPGWQQTRMDNFNTIVHGMPVDHDLVQDGWTKIFGEIGVFLGSDASRAQMVDFELMEQIRARVDQEVHDPATAESLKPYYNIMCKRPGFHDGYLAAFNHPNVTLVDTQGAGVERITEKGLVVDGVEYEIDCLIYATGFEYQTQLSRRNGYEIHGRHGQPLSDKWKDGMSTLWGYHIRDFPNCFILGNGQSAVTPNFTHMLNEAGKHVAYVVKHCLDEHVDVFEPTAEAEQAWVEHIMSFAGIRQQYDRECTPSYYNNEGQVNDVALTRNNFYPGGAIGFISILQEWRGKGDFEQFQLRKR